jgi:peptide chain release factor 1
MFERIAEIEARYQELEDRLGEPSLARDPAKLRELTQELAALRELVTAYREWKRVSASLAENEELASDGDAEIRELAKAELPELRARKESLEQSLKKLLAPKDPRDQKSVVLEIRPGTGGDEAALFAADLFRMYTRYAQGKKWQVELLSLTETEGGGAKEVVANITGTGVFGRLKYESGVHRVQRVPVTESQGRIHTSTATVAVLPEADVADIVVDEKDLRRAEREHDGLGDPHHSLADGLGRSVSGREVAAQEQGQGAEGVARAAPRPGTDSARLRARGRAQGPDRQRRPERAHPHVQLSAEPSHRSPRGSHSAPARPRDGGRDRRARRSRRDSPRSGSSAGGHVSAGADWTLMEFLRWTTDFFKQHDVPQARLDAELLLAHVLGSSRMDLYLGFDKPLGEADRARYRELIRRRAKERVPVAYLTERREFWSLAFRVTSDVLIPRPETETLVRVALDQKPRRALEIGVGSGCISAALARELPSLEIVACDVSRGALEIARENLAALGVLERVTLVEARELGQVAGAFDLVLSNPPYVASGDLAGLAPELRHEPALALDGGPDGLDVIRQICADAPARVERPGALALEVGAGQAAAVAELLRATGAAEVETFADLAGIPRVVLGRYAESG